MSTFLTRVKKTTVTAELLGEVAPMQAAMPPKDRHVFEARALRTFELLDEKGLMGDGGTGRYPASGFRCDRSRRQGAGLDHAR
jgi:hypothetical protein